MSQADKATAFHALHVSGTPLVLYNIWDAGGAKTLAKAGAPAVATGSWSVAAAHGYKDGEAIPLDFALRVAARIAATVEVPLTVDFEGGYAVDPATLSGHITQLIDTGAVGLNFEDRVVGGAGLHAGDVQADPIRAIRAAAEAAGVPLFINARTDGFLQSKPADHRDHLDAALERAAAYAEAGASGFFVPGLTDLELIAELVRATPLPVNVMLMDPMTIAGATEAGVARVSFGPAPYATAQADLAAAFQRLT
ncbi:MAG: isocitrate lyase/phosphoenolpyruvate mutase family protein [Pseudomonadota bacterium]